MSNLLNRRDFLRNTAITTGVAMAGVSLSGCQDAYAKSSLESYRMGFAAPPIEKVRVGVIGVGMRGPGHVANFLKMKNVEVKAICDIRPEKVATEQERVVKAGQPKPDGYSRGDEDYKRMCQRDDLDYIMIATPWRWHVPMALEAMNNGKHAGSEVPFAVTMDECWQLVDTAERTQKHCIIAENCCYDRTELMILNMVRQGVLGELLHGECAYRHDLRSLKYGDKYQGRWRIQHSIDRNGDLYPTHGIGPIAQDMNINRGGQFDYLVSVATKSRGLNIYEAREKGLKSTEGTTKYKLGDIITTIIKTKAGETIVITHDTDSPRPYSRDILVQGTKGIVQKYPTPKVYIEGTHGGVLDESKLGTGGSLQSHNWEEIDKYYEKYDHPLYKTLKESSKGGGHGGMDYMMNYRIVQCLQKGLPMDMDVYDAAAWSVISELSERSIAKGSAPMSFPDFTRGTWKTRAPLGIVNA